MKGKTRNYNNQWLIQAYGNTKTAILNYKRVLKSVDRWDKHHNIAEEIRQIIMHLENANSILPMVQFLFNDPRMVKIEV